jgi:uncharacterized protein YjbI with pentapeptide repeats/DNA-binding Xre family transcriptional regulator
MSDGSGGKKRKRLTLVASLEGLEKAEKSLLRLGFGSQSNFAKAQLLSRSSVSNFFNRKPIQLDTFKKICEGLKLEWQDIAEIAGIAEENIAQKLKEKQENLTSYIEMGVGAMTTLIRQIIVLDESSQTKAEIRLSGDINSVQNFQLIASILREYGGNTIKITDIKEGSIKLILEGSKKDINQLLLRIKSGELTEIDGFSIETTQILSRDLENKGSNKEKWRLVKRIIKNSAIKRNLGGADLSDSDLSDSDLSDSDLSDSDLRGANLRGANLRGANLRGANLSSVDLSSVDLSSADLSGVDLSSADLSGVDLSSADLSGANLRGANLRGANLRGANLSDTNLRLTNLRNFNLSDTNLRGADLSDANLSDANLRGADLSNANLSGANLRGADLSDTNLSDANVERARFSSGIAFGITEQLKQELIKRGAIFEESLGDRSSISSGSPQLR